MTREWAPSDWGQTLTGSPNWRLRLDDDTFVLTVNGKEQLRAPIDDRSPIVIRKGVYWTDLTFRSDKLRRPFKVDGLPNARAEELEQAISHLITARRKHARHQTFNTAFRQIDDWIKTIAAHMMSAQKEMRWVSHIQQQKLLSQRPKLAVSIEALWELFRDPDIQSQLPDDRSRVENWLTYWQRDWSEYFGRKNEEHVQRELIDCKELFDRVESQPLTEEQARAVVTFDNRVLVIASAGSGKTSTMVAKAAYAIHRNLVAPERILLLAFNKEAAKELQERAAKSFKRLGWEDITVTASTFHAFGRSIIGKATGRMPDVPDWAVSDGAGLRKLLEIVDQLKDRSPGFRTDWDLFRLVFGQDLPKPGAELDAEEWDREGTGYVRTLHGERVRSNEERVVANWLFYHGVNYIYEPKYEYDTTTAEYRQYRPDFYYPDIKLYHEHLALDADGHPPPHFTRYLSDLAWKRQEHRRRGTQLVETTSHQLRTGKLYPHLASALTERGIVLDPNPDRAVPKNGQPPMANDELVSLVRSFISHAKSNCLTIDVLKQRLEDMPEDVFKYRHRMFLKLVAPVMQEWDACLRAEEGIDFEDMLNEAAEQLETGRLKSPYHLVMADEFQDASRARARLCRALAKSGGGTTRMKFGPKGVSFADAPERYFFAVGDDWQSINRFAGADMSVMTGFRDWFGDGELLRLEQTFRCPQELCDVSSRFVSKNPAQIAKTVRSTTPVQGPAFEAYQVEHNGQIQAAVGGYLARLYQGILDGAVPPGRDSKLSVFVLGRYNSDRAFVPPDWQARYGKHIDLRFITIHRSKGAEADFVLLPGMVRRGFPNSRAHDPVMNLVMPDGDTYPLSEERRLFYVALTRARRGVTMFTVAGQNSIFLNELVADQAVVVKNLDGEEIEKERCPVCKYGVFITRNGPFGPFKSCSSYPRCENKPGKEHASTSKPGPSESSRDEGATPARMSPVVEVSTSGPTQSDFERRAEAPPLVSGASFHNHRVPPKPGWKDEYLFQALRSWRTEEAKSEGVLAYSILSDSTLREIALYKPKSLGELSQIGSVGARKLRRYGDELLRAIEKFEG